jgi:hypothetical protein
MAGALGLAPDTKGAVVTEVEPNSHRCQGRASPEDLIVESRPQARRWCRGSGVGIARSRQAHHLLKVRRGGNYLFLTVPA